jgi:signal transduction histidine kinase
LAVRLDYQGVSGLLLLGRRPLGRDLGEEETSAVLLLVEQLGVTLYNSVLQQERLAAERRALQNEKLSTLGLLSSCITHEIKNPLSSIKTIATVLAEQLGPDSEHAEDLRLILSEVDRLATTTSQLLQFARPSSADSRPVTVREAVEGTLHVLTHLAKRRGVSIQTSLADDLPPVAADANAVREIFFNLLVNSIDAAASSTSTGGGHVSMHCHRNGRYVVATLSDDGPGVPAEVQDRLFEPFMTTKECGTGLGLYIVSRRVAELAGEIHFDSVPGNGTSFTVKLPQAE